MAKTIDRDRGFSDIFRTLKKLSQKPFVKVGLMGTAKKKDAKNLFVVEVGVFHEFGTQHTPERSFMRSTFDERKEAWFRRTKRIHSLILARRMEVDTGLALLGAFIEKDIKDRIRKQDPSWEPLSEKTIERKKSTTILIDTAQMINSIRYKVIY